MRPCPSPTRPVPARGTAALAMSGWGRSLAATAVATLAACGGGGGGGEATQPTNVAPTVSINTPIANASVVAGASVRIGATAGDADDLRCAAERTWAGPRCSSR